MRRVVLTIALCGLAGLTACQNQSDPDMKELIKTLAANQAKSGGDSGDVSELNKTIKSLRDELDTMKRSLSDEMRREIEKSSEDQGRKLDQIEKDLNLVSKANSETRDDVANFRRDITGMFSTTSAIKESVDSVKSEISMLDPKQFIESVKTLGEKERELQKANSANDDLKEEIEELKGKNDALLQQMEKLKAEMTELQEGNIRNHPDYKKLREDLKELKDKYDTLKKEYKKMEDYAKELADGKLPEVKEGDSSKSSGDSSTKPAESSWTGEIHLDTTFDANSQQWQVFGKPTKGDLPAKGQILWILDVDGEFLCEMEVMVVYQDQGDFAGYTVAWEQGKSPRKGDKIVLPTSGSEAVPRDAGASGR